MTISLYGCACGQTLTIQPGQFLNCCAELGYKRGVIPRLLDRRRRRHIQRVKRIWSAQ